METHKIEDYPGKCKCHLGCGRRARYRLSRLTKRNVKETVRVCRDHLEWLKKQQPAPVEPDEHLTEADYQTWLRV